MRSSIRLAAATLAFVLATPSFAYIFQADGAPERESRRLIDAFARAQNSIRSGITRQMRTRKGAEAEGSGLVKLRRASGKHFRSTNRKPKEGTNRYRTLHPNTRSLRRAAEGVDAALPNRIVQSGSEYDRPTRRDITGKH